MSEATNDLCRSTVRATCFGLKHSLLLVGLVLAVMLDALNATIFGLARRHVLGTFHLTPDEAAWLGIVYLAATLALFTCGGWLRQNNCLGDGSWVSLSHSWVTSHVLTRSVSH